MGEGGETLWLARAKQTGSTVHRAGHESPGEDSSNDDGKADCGRPWNHLIAGVGIEQPKRNLDTGKQATVDPLRGLVQAFQPDTEAPDLAFAS